MSKLKQFKIGDRVICNGNNESYVLNYYTDKIVTVRIWRGQRHIGDTIVNESELKLIRGK